MNNNSGYYYDYDEFIKKGYGEWKNQELRDIGSGFGIQLSGTNREIYDRVVNVLLNRKKLKIEHQEKETINSFYKVQVQLLIIEGITQTELLFWSIFRNKVTFSYFKYKNLYNYERLFSIKYIYENYSNANEIIRDKVKNNNYLVFNTNGYGNKPENGAYCGFSRNISSSFVSNFSTGFVSNTSGFGNSGLGGSGFGSSGLGGSGFGNSGLSGSRFGGGLGGTGNSVGFGSRSSLGGGSGFNDTSNLLFVEQNKDQIISNIVESVKPQRFSGVVKQESVRNYKICKLVRLLELSKIKGFIKFSDSELYRDSFKLKHLLSIYSLFSEIYKDVPEFNKVTEPLIQFSNEQLKSSVFELLKSSSSLLINKSNNNNNDSELKNEILKYIESLNSLKKNEDINFGYYVLFKDPNEIKNQIKRSTNFQDVLDCISKVFSGDNSDISRKNTLKNYNYQFISNGNLQLIEQFLYSSENNDNNTRDNSFNYYTFFGKPSIVHNIFQNIKSTQVLDYLFNINKDLFFSDSNSNWISLSTLELVKYYENLMELCGNKLSLYLNNGNTSFTSVSINSLLRAIENPSLYNCIHGFSLDFYNKLIQKSIMVYGKQDVVIDILKTNKIKDFKLYSIFDDDIRAKSLRLIEWILQNGEIIRNNEQELPIREVLYIIVNKGSKDEIKIELNNSYLISLFNSVGKYIELFNQFPINKLITIYYSREDYTTELLDHLFNNYRQGNAEIEFKQTYNPTVIHINKILESLVCNNNLPLLKFIAVNHPLILTKVSKSTPKGLELADLKKKLVDSISNGNYQMSEFFLNYISLTEKEFSNVLENNLKHHYLQKFNYKSSKSVEK